MARKPPFQSEKQVAGKDTKKLEKREQDMLARLEEARQAQARAIQRFVQAQERMVRLEARLQAVHQRLTASSSSPDDPNQYLEILPTSGDLELIEHFGARPDIDDDPTERIPVLRSTPPPTDQQAVTDKAEMLREHIEEGVRANNSRETREAAWEEQERSERLKEW